MGGAFPNSKTCPCPFTIWLQTLLILLNPASLGQKYVALQSSPLFQKKSVLMQRTSVPDRYYQAMVCQTDQSLTCHHCTEHTLVSGFPRCLVGGNSGWIQLCMARDSAMRFLTLAGLDRSFWNKPRQKIFWLPAYHLIAANSFTFWSMTYDTTSC